MSFFCRRLLKMLLSAVPTGIETAISLYIQSRMIKSYLFWIFYARNAMSYIWV